MGDDEYVYRLDLLDLPRHPLCGYLVGRALLIVWIGAHSG